MIKFISIFLLTLSINTSTFAQDLPVTQWEEEVKQAFSSAENKIFPKLENEPHPDVEKCPCKGSGKISQGDGHKTDCPFHGNKPDPVIEHDCRCVSPGYLCACEDEYGECACPSRMFSQTNMIHMSKMVRLILIAAGILLLISNKHKKRGEKDV